jgi:hypothetical protein
MRKQSDLDKPQLNEALAEIAAIRHQVARGVEFRGYGPATLLATAAMAVLAAAFQAFLLPEPTEAIARYLGLWLATAAAAATLIGTEAITRTRRLHSGLAPEMLAAAAEQFLPAAAAGVLLTVVLMRFAPETIWMLPGLWQIVFSLGVFASLRFLPRRIFIAGFWYLLCGLACLVFARGGAALSPWAMGVPFGIGQVLIAVALHSKTWEADDRAQ